MTRHILDTLAALALAALLMAGPALDGMGMLSDTTHPSAAALQAQTQAQADARRELAAQALCAADGGPNTGYRWATDGSLVCTTKHGRAVSTVKVGAL